MRAATRRVEGQYLMGYAVRNDGVYGVRAVDGPEACMGHETYSEVFVERTETIEDQLAAIEAEFAPKIAALQTALVAATLTDGPIMDGNISSLRTEWTALLNTKSAAIEALLI